VVQPNTKHSSGFRSKAQIDLDEVVQSGSGNTTLPKSRGAADHVRGSWACRRAECAGQRQQLYLDGVVQPNTSVKLDMPASECGLWRPAAAQLYLNCAVQRVKLGMPAGERVCQTAGQRPRRASAQRL
jgi:hypothetical protein